MKKHIQHLFMVIIIVSSTLIIRCKPDETLASFPPSASCPGNETVEYAGETYSTVQMGDQCWMAKNLNTGVQINSQTKSTDNDTIEKYCYDNDPLNCDKFGGLYPWSEIMQYASGNGTQGICPPGWGVPSAEDFAKLYMYVDGYPAYLMKNDDSWGTMLNDIEKECSGCTGKTGFDLLPSGMFHFNAQNGFLEMGVTANMWAAYQERAYTKGKYFTIYEYVGTDYLCFPVRCIKNE